MKTLRYLASEMPLLGLTAIEKTKNQQKPLIEHKKHPLAMLLSKGSITNLIKLLRTRQNSKKFCSLSLFIFISIIGSLYIAQADFLFSLATVKNSLLNTMIGMGAFVLRVDCITSAPLCIWTGFVCFCLLEKKFKK